MDETYRIESVDQPSDAAWEAIGGGIRDFNIEQAGPDQGKQLCILMYDAAGAIVGGLIGATYWEWLHVDLLWVRQDLRGCGHGSRLLAEAEEEARRRGARNAYLDTFTFQAPGFYERHGYRVFGELEGFPAGHRRYFMSKPL